MSTAHTEGQELASINATTSVNSNESAVIDSKMYASSLQCNEFQNNNCNHNQANKMNICRSETNRLDSTDPCRKRIQRCCDVCRQKACNIVKITGYMQSRNSSKLIMPMFAIFWLSIHILMLLYERNSLYELEPPLSTNFMLHRPDRHRHNSLGVKNHWPTFINGVSAFDHSERIQLRDEAKTMFYHAYKSYLSTYPADEVLPISCRGRFRQVEDSSDIDDSIGNFSLTLVDSLDTLVMMGDIPEFDTALKRIIKDLDFDTNIIVSVFETNIRMLGGLLSAHILAKSIQDESDMSIRHLNVTTRQQLSWYKSEMLDLAEDLGRRLLPAFDTKTGIPHPRVNLKHGLNTEELKSVVETCTACAGSLILEFATLSRLTGDSIYEDKARRALDSLWNHRHQSTDLVGTVLNIDSGEWVRRESGVGAGSDSYYEYLLKAYILLGDPEYLHRFNRHYSSVMRYISRGPFLIDVHMHRPNRVAKGFMDALSAFWPGLQVLKGDLRSAIATHAMFSEVIKRHSYLPEAFTTDFQVYWANHQMRPEFLESTYFLHRATGEDYYLDIGKSVLEKLRDLKVSCGFAGLKDVRTRQHDDKMSSFVLAETLKYLYLLFSRENETYVDLDQYVLSTEGHPLPVKLGLINANTDQLAEGTEPMCDEDEEELVFLDEIMDTQYKDSECPLKVPRQHSDASHGSGPDIDKSVQKPQSEREPTKADLARLLIRMSDRFDQGDRSVISIDDYETSCPSLEVQAMRFDRNFHPFLNKKIGSASDSMTQLEMARLFELIREFTTSDPDYKRWAVPLGLSFNVQSNGVIRLMMNPPQGNDVPISVAE